MLHKLLITHASMEPSSVEDGNLCRSTVQFGTCPPLQWSRPQLRTETWRVCRRHCDWCTASMEPSSVEDGNASAFDVDSQAVAAASMEPSSVEDGNMPA